MTADIIGNTSYRSSRLKGAGSGRPENLGPSRLAMSRGYLNFRSDALTMMDIITSLSMPAAAAAAASAAARFNNVCGFGLVAQLQGGTVHIPGLILEFSLQLVLLEHHQYPHLGCFQKFCRFGNRYKRSSRFTHAALSLCRLWQRLIFKIDAHQLTVCQITFAFARHGPRHLQH